MAAESASHFTTAKRLTNKPTSCWGASFGTPGNGYTTICTEFRTISHVTKLLIIITSLCNIMINSGMIPTEMKHSVFITLPKKPKAMICTEFRTISLMSHVTKLLLKIIQP